MTTVTPIKYPPVAILRNAMEVCTAYEDAANVSAESAQQQLPRIRNLLSLVLAQLGEPYSLTVERMATELQHAAEQAVVSATKGTQHAPDIIDQRWARDSAAIICRTQVTWGMDETLAKVEP